MDAKHRLQVFLCAAVAGGLTAAVYLADASRLDTTQTEESLQWARKTISQVEALTLSARDLNEHDPLGWALGHLSQGTEPRAIRIFKTDDRAPGQSGEKFSYDKATGTFSYTKPFPPEGDTVLHIEYSRGFRGFLNTSTNLGNDFAIACVFVALFLLLAGSTRSLGTPRGAAALRIEVADWASNAKSLLKDLGGSIKAVVEGAQSIANFSSKAFDALRSLRNRIHGGLRTAHDARRALQKNAETAKRLETLALSLITESRRLGVTEGSTLATLAREIHGASVAVGEQARQTSTFIEKLEVELEPWSVDADVAYHAFDGIADAVAGMNEGIRGAKSSVIENVRRINDLKSEMLETKKVSKGA